MDYGGGGRGGGRGDEVLVSRVSQCGGEVNLKKKKDIAILLPSVPSRG